MRLYCCSCVIFVATNRTQRNVEREKASSCIHLNLHTDSSSSLRTHFSHTNNNTMAERKPNIKFADISDEMQNDAVEVATKAIQEHQMEKDIAAQIKREFDKKHSPTWQCIVGRQFGADVVHESKHFVYFYLGQVAVLLWKAG